MKRPRKFAALPFVPTTCAGDRALLGVMRRVLVRVLGPGTAPASPKLARAATPWPRADWAWSNSRVTTDRRGPSIRSSACLGRRPDGLAMGSGTPEHWTMRTFLSDSFALEAASVPAFIELGRDLRQLGAPEDLWRAALEAASDEVRHTRAMGLVAQRFGVEPSPPAVAPSAPKSLDALAIDNAVEGCVRETFGTLVCAYLAERAADPELGDVMREIAEDEARHALLSWRIAGWIEPQLSTETSARLASARADAVIELGTELVRRHAADVYVIAGWPEPRDALRLLDALDGLLWRAADDSQVAS